MRARYIDELTVCLQRSDLTGIDQKNRRQVWAYRFT